MKATPLVRDVTLRDGLQLASKILPTAEKLRLARELFAAGITSVEIGAVVRPDRVPAMADTLDLVRELDADELATCWVLVPNLTGTRRALDAGVRNVQFVLSASDTHNRNNVGRSTEASLADLPAVAAEVAAAGGVLQLSISTAFSCPFEGPIPVDRVAKLLADERVQLASSFVVCDTIGQAVPSSVTELVRTTRDLIDDRWLVFHGHDTWGLGVANGMAALAAGANTLDGTLGGLGGCPFAPGASGNTALEDLLYALRPSWLTPEAFHRLVLAGEQLLSEVDEPQRSRAAFGARRSRPTHEWAMP
ncbi:hydroxymethylglutaryl-CoA lyase [Saccharopolyspora sp. K220]|uniref:hydroxymethylglutaryl-CoA lyase n=1 Tax=Saccharopolyspora soli TaxID=2926618 RepID=UPI001F593946|nr:hydroxymethylglutaryl-CoA lyase [Saccharopolyspora soli]MCI2420825.1 hydroxymethylglutaryl-CoA lyase [Saccharopolyspora soli]